MRTLDDVYGAEVDEFALEQVQNAIRERLEWDDAADARALRFADREIRTPWGGLAFE